MENSLAGKEKMEAALRQHADMIYRIAYQNTGNKADADDIFQDVCMCLLTKNAPLDDEAHLKHWLIRVTVNKCNSFHKSAWQSKTQALDDNILYEPEDSEILSELMKLPKNYRNAIYLHYYEGYSTAEIGAIMGKSSNTICSWLARGRKRLKDFLSE